MPKYDPTIIPDLGVQLPPGNALLKIEALDDNEETSTGKYQIKATLRVLEPTEFADQPFFERFVIGTDTDPGADDPNSWRGFAAQRYRDMLLKAGVSLTGTIEGDAAVAKDQPVGVIIENEVQGATNRDGTPNRYAGRVQARVKSFFRPGEKSTGNGAAPAVAQPQAKAPAPAAAQAPKPASAASAPKAAAPIKCGVCDEMVPKAEFAKHVAVHEAEEE